MKFCVRIIADVFLFDEKLRYVLSNKILATVQGKSCRQVIH